jgi:hypothetical protein
MAYTRAYSKDMHRFLLGLAAMAAGAAVPPSDWVPARWDSSTPLALLEGSPVNCLLVEWNDGRTGELRAFAAAATERNLAALAVIRPGADPARPARAAAEARFSGIVLEGDFPANTADKVRDVLAGSRIPVIEITSRAAMRLGAGQPVAGTYQGLWAGIQILEGEKAKAGPTGGVWIDTNSGFLRSARALGGSQVWLASRPPEGKVFKVERYLQMICDTEMAGGRWVVALDSDFSARLAKGDAAARDGWRRMMQYLAFFESRTEWRSWQPFGRLAIVQDTDAASLLSGGILDMIAVKHTPVRPVPRTKLAPGALAGVELAVNVDPAALSQEQRDILRAFTRGGGTLLNAPPGWKGPGPASGSITLEKEELERLDSIWKEVNSMIGRRNLGARLFNVSTMLSNLVSTPDAKDVIVHLVNYSEYPVENVTVHLLGEFKRARLYTPDGGERKLEVYKTEEGSGVDIEQVAVAATLRLD